MNILCDYCGKDSGIEKSENFGVNAAQVQHRAGWIPKILAMYTGGAHRFIACSPSCAKALCVKIFDECCVTEEKKMQVADFLKEAKKHCYSEIEIKGENL